MSCKNIKGEFELFNRLVSKRHFEKVKSLFNVQTINELQAKIRAIQETDKNSGRIKYQGSFDSVTPIHKLIEIERIGTIR